MSAEYDIEHLLLRRLQGIATDAENRRIANWAAMATANQAVLDRLDNESVLREDLDTLFGLADTNEGQERLQRMGNHVQQHITSRQVKRMPRWIPYAAAVALIALGSTWLILRKNAENVKTVASASYDIQPGGNRAVLKLADGRTITLDETLDGIVVDNNSIIYNNGASLATIAAESERAGQRELPPSTLLELTTPNGGTYQLTLDDGTKVWLNASSTIRYPAKFDSNMRIVELEGEAFFDVSQIQARGNGRNASDHIPFIVKTKKQTIEVIGTQFNISAYANEAETKTTLVEGVVRVGLSPISQERVDRQAPITMRPGEQATTRGTTIAVTTVNTERYTAWKNGLFYFKRTPVAEIMRQVSRWYDVEVIYTDNIPQETFSGKVDRDVTLMGLLKILQISAIDVKLSNKKVIVGPMSQKKERNN